MVCMNMKKIEYKKIDLLVNKRSTVLHKTIILYFMAKYKGNNEKNTK